MNLISDSRSVFVAVVGKPNTGKSSLVNHLVGEKVAIVTSKPQTTRTRITGILTKGPLQYVFYDTPGLLEPRNRLGQRMARIAESSATDGDAVLMLFDPFEPLDETQLKFAKSLAGGGLFVIAAVNKIDIAPPEKVAACKAAVEALGTFAQVLLISAQTGDGTEELLEVMATAAAEGPHFFDDDAYTDQPERKIVEEIIREKLLLHLRQEIPHGIAVAVERFKEREGKPVIEIDATIYCEKKSHKGMVIGKSGLMLKTIASEARADSEELLHSKVFLQCWVKVRSDWRNNDNALNMMGFKN